MQYTQFEKIMLTYKRALSDMDALYKIGLDLSEGPYDLMSHMYVLFNESMGIQYNPHGVDWIDWYIFETDWQQKKNYEAYNERKELIAQDLKGLWELLESDYRNDQKPEMPLDL
jgi:hypothetical protein